MGNIFDDYYYNEVQKIKIFGTLSLFDNKSEKGILEFTLDDINKHLKDKNIDISNKNILDIVNKYYEKGVFSNLYLAIN